MHEEGFLENIHGNAEEIQMGITLTIVGGLILITLITVVSDYMGKRKKTDTGGLEERVALLEKNVRILEERVSDKDGKIERLEADIGFMNKLIEDKSK